MDINNPSIIEYMIFEKPIKNIKENIKLKKMGFIQDQQGIINRYLNEKENWNQHLENTKKFILKSSESKNKNKVVVLGSGWLLDLPIDELSKLFKEVILIDILHPKQIQNLVRKYKNVTLIKEDITGGLINFIYTELKPNNLKKKKQLSPSSETFSFELPTNTDFVISLNIMLQLHIILVDYMKRFDSLSSTDFINLEKDIQKSHLNILPAGKSCLITDIEEEIIDKKDHVIGVNPLIHVDLPQGNFMQWKWKFDSKMTYRDNYKTYFNTKAIDF